MQAHLSSCAACRQIYLLWKEGKSACKKRRFIVRALQKVPAQLPFSTPAKSWHFSRWLYLHQNPPGRRRAGPAVRRRGWQCRLVHWRHAAPLDPMWHGGRTGCGRQSLLLLRKAYDFRLLSNSVRKSDAISFNSGSDWFSARVAKRLVRSRSNKKYKSSKA